MIQSILYTNVQTASTIADEIHSTIIAVNSVMLTGKTIGTITIRDARAVTSVIRSGEFDLPTLGYFSYNDASVLFETLAKLGYSFQFAGDTVASDSKFKGRILNFAPSEKKLHLLETYLPKHEFSKLCKEL